MRTVLITLFAVVVCLYIPSPVTAANDYQKCRPNTTCQIGEFLYDDEYVPIATASCTLTARDPAGAVVLNSVAMTANTDGWYQYGFDTTNHDEGLYRGQLCCSVTGSYLCLDKTFIIEATAPSASEVAGKVWDEQTASHTATGSFGKNLQNPTLTASDFWSYANRTLTGYSSLIADTWSYSTRTLTGFGGLATDIWNAATRTLTGSTVNTTEKIATETSVEKSTERIVASIAAQNNKNMTDNIQFGKNSLVFSLTVTNPSATEQPVPYTYYLPVEVKKDNVGALPAGPELRTDIATGSLYVTGAELLGPSKATTFDIEIKDVWTHSPAEIGALRQQADTLVKPLAKTSYYGQGAVIHSDILVNLEKILDAQARSNTPESHIKAFRDGTIYLRAAKDKIGDLKSLVASAGSVKTLFGYIGGVQVFAVWGIIIVLIAGFVFLALYMRALRHKDAPDHVNKSKRTPKTPQSTIWHQIGGVFNRHKIGFAIFFLTAGTTAALVSIAVRPMTPKYTKSGPVQKIVQQVKPTATPLPTATPEAKLEMVSVIEEKVNVREGAGTSYKKIGVVQKGNVYPLISRITDKLGDTWMEIRMSPTKTGWLLSEFVEMKESNTTPVTFSQVKSATPSAVLGVAAQEIKVLIKVPDGERVNVRANPTFDSKIVMSLAQEITTERLEQKDGWIKIEFGWVPSIYVQELKK